MDERELLRAWADNATPWVDLVREGRLASRIAVTNWAILQAVGPGRGGRLLDLGCGEGWLAHRLSGLGWQVTGVDAIPALVQAAASGGGGEFLVAPYERLGEALAGRRFEVVVANFSLLGESSTEAALRAVWKLLEPKGRLLIQTLHPLSVTPYVEGWRQEDWRGMGELNCAPTPWFFRTFEGWSRLLVGCGFREWSLGEPRAPGAEAPSSLLLRATR